MKKNIFYLVVVTLTTLSLVSSAFAECPSYTQNWYDEWYSLPTDKPIIVSQTPIFSGMTIITNKCYTQVTVPIASSVKAGQRIYLQGRIFNSVVGYPISNPKAWIYFDGNLVGSVQGDFNGNYYFSFPVSEFMKSGMHVVSVNATMDKCEPVIVHSDIFVDEPISSSQVYSTSVTNLGSLVIETTDCSSEKPIQAYVVLSPGVYGQISKGGEALFSNIPPASYSYIVSASGYGKESGTVVVETDKTTTESVCLLLIQPSTIAEPPKQIDAPGVCNQPNQSIQPLFQIYSVGLPLAFIAVLMIFGAIYKRYSSKRCNLPEGF